MSTSIATVIGDCDALYETAPGFSMLFICEKRVRFGFAFNGPIAGIGLVFVLPMVAFYSGSHSAVA